MISAVGEHCPLLRLFRDCCGVLKAHCFIFVVNELVWFSWQVINLANMLPWSHVSPFQLEFLPVSLQNERRGGRAGETLFGKCLLCMVVNLSHSIRSAIDGRVSYLRDCARARAMQCSRCTPRLVAAPSDECEISIGKVNPRLRRRRPTIVIVSAMCHLPGDTQGGT